MLRAFFEYSRFGQTYVLSMLISCLVGCGLCSERVLKEVPSPDGSHIVTEFERNCGAPGGFVYHVNLRESSRTFGQSNYGKIDEGEVFSYESGQVRMIWLDGSHLLIEHEGDRIYSQEKSWKKIEINYKKVDRISVSLTLPTLQVSSTNQYVQTKDQ
jgi:hypothetical protein